MAACHPQAIQALQEKRRDPQTLSSVREAELVRTFWCVLLLSDVLHLLLFLFPASLPALFLFLPPPFPLLWLCCCFCCCNRVVLNHWIYIRLYDDPIRQYSIGYVLVRLIHWEIDSLSIVTETAQLRVLFMAQDYRFLVLKDLTFSKQVLFKNISLCPSGGRDQ